MRKNFSNQVVSFQMISATDGSDVTTGTPAVYYTISAGTQATGGGTKTHEGNGQWSYTALQAETNGNQVAFTMVLAGSISQTVNVWPVAFDPADVDDLGLTALTGHTPQTGDSFARLGAPAGASVSADMAVVDAVADAILIDTDELQTDWTNGGRLDLILDDVVLDTGTTLPATLSTIDGNVDAILVDTGTDGVVISATTALAIADALLNRDMSAVSDTNARTPLNALRILRNKYSVAGTTLTVTKEDDSTSAWTSVVTTDAAAEPITGSDPT